MRNAVRRTVGIDIHRVRDPAVLRLTRSTLDYELDDEFNRLVDAAVGRSGSGPRGRGDGPRDRRAPSRLDTRDARRVRPTRALRVDLDLYEPTKAALEHFFPLLSVGGVVLCDDVGSIRWPGVAAAVEEFSGTRSHGARLLRMATGQAFLFKE